VYLITWDAYWTDSYLSSGLANHKAFQLSTGSTDSIWLEPQARYAGDFSTSFNKSTDVASLTMRSYNALGGSATYSSNTKSMTGPNVTKLDPILPMQSQFIVKPNRWVRHWVRLDMRSNDYDYMDYWVADETRNAVQIYQGLQLTASMVNKFWIEFNTSTDRFVRGNTRDLVAYVRNVVVLRNVPAADLPELLEPPVGSNPGPPPPPNVKIVK
jgi:hypothetical protein